MTDFSTTLVRCSALDLVMTEQRGKTNMERYLEAKQCLIDTEVKFEALKKKDGTMGNNYQTKIAELKKSIPQLEKVKGDEVLSETCKSYLIQAYVLSKYGRIREVQTKQMVKGTVTEEDCIDIFSVIERRVYAKNVDRISNDFIIGTPDLFDGKTIFESNEIIDIKSCWDIFTFLKNVDVLSSVDNPYSVDYYWQVQGYLALTGAKIGTLAFCLVNTPDSIIEGEKYNLLRKMDVATEEDADFKKEMAKLIANRRFDDIPMSERLLTYSFERNDSDIDRIYKKVAKCREFLSEFEQTHLKFSKTYRKSPSKDVV